MFIINSTKIGSLWVFPIWNLFKFCFSVFITKRLYQNKILLSTVFWNFLKVAFWKNRKIAKKGVIKKRVWYWFFDDCAFFSVKMLKKVPKKLYIIDNNNYKLSINYHQLSIRYQIWELITNWLIINNWSQQLITMVDTSDLP